MNLPNRRPVRVDDTRPLSLHDVVRRMSPREQVKYLGGRIADNGHRAAQALADAAAALADFERKREERDRLARLERMRRRRPGA